MCNTDDESGGDQNDVDSEVTFEGDTDDTIVTEEDWIDYTKTSTVDAMDKMERAKIRCWNRTHEKWNGN